MSIAFLGSAMSWTRGEPLDAQHDLFTAPYTSSATSSASSSPIRGRRRSPTKTWSASSIGVARGASSSPTGCSGFGRQARRLQRRHANFRGTNISPRPISPPSARAPSLSRGSIFYSTSDESSPQQTTNNSSPNGSAHSTLTSSSILEQLASSTRKARQKRQKPSVHDIWADDTATVDCSGHDLGLHDCVQSPPQDMKLREGSINPKTPSRGGSLRFSKGSIGQKRSPPSRLPSLSSSSYILHMEEQLASLQAELETLTSPKSPNSRTIKLRALTNEVRVLRDEVNAWEEKYEERVQEAINERAKVDTSLKGQLKGLERALDGKDEKIMDLECELETLRKGARDAESLEAENKSLSKRLDVLTELLALSPTKSGFTFDLSSDDPRSRKSDRPRSMFPRIPCSPERPFGKGAGTGTTAMPSEIPEDNAEALDLEREDSPPRLSRGSMDGVATPSGGYSGDGGILFGRSRPVSIVSDASGNTTSFGSPALGGLDARARRQRKMRHFRSGSCGPKALILPAASFSTPTATSVAAGAVIGENDLTTPKAKGLSISTPGTDWGHSIALPAASSDLVYDFDSTAGLAGSRRRFGSSISSSEGHNTSRMASVSSMTSDFSSTSGRPMSQFETLFAELSRAEREERSRRQVSSSTTTSAPGQSECAETSMFATQISRPRPRPLSRLRLSALAWELAKLPFRLARRTFLLWKTPLWWLLAVFFGRRLGWATTFS